MIFFISDTHFGHQNVIRYTGRPFSSTEEMDETLIANWNNTISPTDQVYHLGDFSLAKKDYAKRILDRLNGQIFLVRGNHDHSDIRKLDRFAWVKDYYELKVPDEEMDLEQHIVMCHYPIESWNKRHHGSWHLHGHCHGSLPSPDWQARLDVGVDVHKFKPISYEEVKALMTFKVFKPIDHHRESIRK